MSAWTWIDEQLALAVHEQLLVRHGGPRGVRDSGLLQSALAPRQLQAYGERVDLAVLAAAYTAGIVQNHPFVDGNKRTGFVVGVLFLELNGAHFTASEEAAAEAVLSLAAGVGDEDAYCAFLRMNANLPANDR
ncbi:MAG: type II toxin-antitoxin system death-on-curing family toxin [Caulobacteraceae bacterium]|nr:type II toxin-antitoxin system death-on-curing family toxin [Caulobacteraceae bacterium]